MRSTDGISISNASASSALVALSGGLYVTGTTQVLAAISASMVDIVGLTYSQTVRANTLEREV
jgi:hypothetical protein